jgi:heterodisulfide reductase subunit A-like polyferredoxin
MASRKIEHGVVIMATGAGEYRPTEYLYGENPNVVTQLELSEKLEDKQFAAGLEQVVMIQCVGSRNESNPNCSRICCQSAVKNAIHIKRDNPEARVFILYRDIRTYGLMEDYYTEARRLGVMFFRFDPEDAPVSTPVGESGERDVHRPYSGPQNQRGCRTPGVKRRHGRRRHRGTGPHHENQPEF